MNKIEHNFLYVIWKNPRTRRNYIIGKLTRETDKYTFEYCEEYMLAKKDGWELLSAFPDEKVYSSDKLFAAFAARLPDPKRKGIENILKKYGLNEYDGYELLKKSTGRLPIDTYEFIDPIFPEDETVQRDFYIMGIRYHGDCEGIDCSKLKFITNTTELLLQREPDNPYDPDAVRVVSKDNIMVGYIPRYYSKSISQRLLKGMTYLCKVIEFQPDKKCENCIKVRLRIPRE